MEAERLGYTYFGIRFFAECYGGREHDRLEALLDSGKGLSNDCVNPHYKGCDHSVESECAGRGSSEYVFSLVDVKEKGTYTLNRNIPLCIPLCIIKAIQKVCHSKNRYF